MVRVLRHNANRGYRTCIISKDSLTDKTQNIPKISRYHHITNDEFNSILNHIISCWVLIAKTMKVVFSNKFTSNKYKLLQNCLEAELDFLPKVIIYKFKYNNIY